MGSWIQKGLKTLKKQPSSLIFAPLANALRKTKDYKKAIEISQKGLLKNPQFTGGYIVLGQCFFECGEYQKSAKAFEKAFSLNPENLTALRYLGRIYTQLGDLKKGSKIYEMILLYCPDDESAKEILKTLQNNRSLDSFDVQNLSQIQARLEKNPPSYKLNPKMNHKTIHAQAENPNQKPESKKIQQSALFKPNNMNSHPLE